ncbi:MAG TPA: Do family serine endopeptidase [Deltaproteobacteria bacterium]|nr:Do family serine endopeptidase [Deltaproteobacteria bacterium]HPP79856.1 Do family serine endopeptidase [Deltaproteobacteria bacterium]
MAGRLTRYALCVLAAVFLCVSCTRDAGQEKKAPSPGAAPSGGLIKQETERSSSLAKGEIDFRNVIVEVARKNIPAVVHIEVTQSQEIANPFSPFENDPFFRRFFNFPEGPRKFKRELKGIGTGMIISEDGYILTNNHVVAGASQLQVILSNGRQFGAKIVGADPKTDLAVIRINADEKLPTVVFGDSDNVQVGEWVVAIGHPRGLDQTVTQGIISAKHRKGITDPDTYQDFIQTDAAINPGNSGGPLLNLDGQVIGVNAVIASQSGGSEGLGFAIPSNMAVHIARSLIATGKVQRGWLGVSIQDIPFEKMKELKLDSPKGVYVADVLSGGPAHKAGVRPEDVILSVDGKEVADSAELRNLIASTPVGKVVRLGILRSGKRITLDVKVGNLEDSVKFMAVGLREKLGIDVRPVSDKERDRYGLDKDQGVAISWVDPKGPLGKAGFEVGDLILGVEGRPVEGVEDFVSLAGAIKKGQHVSVYALDHRTGRTGTIEVEVR